MTKAVDIAAYIVRGSGGAVEHLTLQKLLYYCQGWSLAWDGKELFPEAICAWRLGPVVPQVWQILKNKQTVGADDVPGDADALSRGQRSTVDGVLEFYGRMPYGELIELSHRERPWREARAGLESSDPGHVALSPATMREFFGSLAIGRGKRVPEEVRRGVRVLLSIPENLVDDLARTDTAEPSEVMHWLATGEDDDGRA